MCIATVYISDGNQTKEVMNEVVTADLTNGSIVLVNILGEEMQFEGKIKSIDFLKSRVVLQSEKRYNE